MKYPFTSISPLFHLYFTSIPFYFTFSLLMRQFLVVTLLQYLGAFA